MEFAQLDASAFAPHPYLVYELAPSATVTVKGTAGVTTTNEHGFRGRRVARRRPPHLRCVVCIGGSSMFGLGVPDDATFPAQLEDRLNAKGAAATETESAPSWAVVNGAVPGYTTHESMGAFLLRWLDYSPDVVVVGDLDADARALLTDGYQSDYGHLWKIWVRPKEGGATGGTLGDAVVRARPSGGARALAASDLRAFETNLRFLADVARGRSIRAVVLLPDPNAAAPGPAREALTRLAERARAVCQATGAVAVAVSSDGESKRPWPVEEAARAIAEGPAVESRR